MFMLKNKICFRWQTPGRPADCIRNEFLAQHFLSTPSKTSDWEGTLLFPTQICNALSEMNTLQKKIFVDDKLHVGLTTCIKNELEEEHFQLNSFKNVRLGTLAFSESDSYYWEQNV
jgi:hypothetical protein